jgi:geranylgeranyl pyrophosphate synthase
MDYSKKVMDKYENQAILHLEQFPESESKKALLRLVEFVVKRNL